MKAACLQVSSSLTARSRQPGRAHFSLNWRNLKELSALIFTVNRAGAGPQNASGDTVFLWPAHTLMPFLVAGRLLVTSSKGGFYQRVISSKSEDSQRLFCLAPASNSLNPQITLQPQVFVYRGLYLHVFVTAACRHCRKTRCAEWIPAGIRKSFCFSAYCLSIPVHLTSNFKVLWSFIWLQKLDYGGVNNITYDDWWFRVCC